MSRVRAGVLCGLRCGASTAWEGAPLARALNSATSDFVTNGPLHDALRRLDQALARVERASVRVAARPDPELSRLLERHERLRARTKEAIEAIDRLTGAS